MKKSIVILLLITMVLTMVGCARKPEDVKNDISALMTEKKQVIVQLSALKESYDTISADLANKKEELALTTHKVEGGDVKYILKLELKQSHFTLDIGKAMKDALNKCEFEIAVDKELYDQQEIGSELLREFRNGSFWAEGSIGDWVITVVDKYEKPVE